MAERSKLIMEHTILRRMKYDFEQTGEDDDMPNLAGIVERFLEAYNGDWTIPRAHLYTETGMSRECAVDLLHSRALELDLFLAKGVRKPSPDDWGSCIETGSKIVGPGFPPTIKPMLEMVTQSKRLA
jgi:hypothetical protein